MRVAGWWISWCWLSEHALGIGRPRGWWVSSFLLCISSKQTALLLCLLKWKQPAGRLFTRCRRAWSVNPSRCSALRGNLPSSSVSWTNGNSSRTICFLARNSQYLHSACKQRRTARTDIHSAGNNASKSGKSWGEFSTFAFVIWFILLLHRCGTGLFFSAVQTYLINSHVADKTPNPLFR